MFIINAPNSVAFSVFGLTIYWYGIIMAGGILSAVLCANSLFNRLFPDEKKDTILSFAPVIIIFGILSARIYYCLINFPYYFSHPLEILDIREGGLSIHGALLGGILCTAFLAFKNKISIYKILDTLGVSAFLGQAIGRWGNFFNSEAYGLPTNQHWGLFIPQSARNIEFIQYKLFHPTFLYESMLDFAGFLILLFVLKKFGKNLSGLTFYFYLIIYALIRFLVEQIRIDSALNIHTVPIAQVVSIIMLIIGITGAYFIIRKNNKA